MRLDQHPLQIQLAEQRFEHCPLMVFAGGVAGLADRHAQSVSTDIENCTTSDTEK